jgi:hypothetical protein
MTRSSVGLRLVPSMFAFAFICASCLQFTFGADVVPCTGSPLPVESSATPPSDVLLGPDGAGQDPTVASAAEAVCSLRSSQPAQGECGELRSREPSSQSMGLPKLDELMAGGPCGCPNTAPVCCRDCNGSFAYCARSWAYCPECPAP